MQVWIPDHLDQYLRDRQELLRKSPIPGVRYPIIPSTPRRTS